MDRKARREPGLQDPKVHREQGHQDREEMVPSAELTFRQIRMCAGVLGVAIMPFLRLFSG